MSPSAWTADVSEFRAINKCVARSGLQRWAPLWRAAHRNCESRETLREMGGSITTSSGKYLAAPGELRTESCSLPAPLADEIQIALRATKLRGSDIRYYQHRRNGIIQVLEPLCLGHEAAWSLQLEPTWTCA